MSANEQIMAVLLEADEVVHVHRSWPRDMLLCVCLMPSGECQLLLFREEERDIFPQRLRKHLGLRADEICLHPPVEGFATRPLLFSDERSLASLLADSPGIVEEASDYSVNYSYALEEGLDPSEFLNHDDEIEEEDFAVQEVDLPAKFVSERVSEASLPLEFTSRRKKPEPVVKDDRNLHFDLAHEASRSLKSDEAGQSALPKFMSRAASEGPGVGFVSARQMQAIDAPLDQFTLAFAEDGDLVIENGRRGRAALIVEDATALYLRDDHKLLAIRHDGALPDEIQISGNAIPAAMRRVLAECEGDTSVHTEDAFIFVTLEERSAILDALAQEEEKEARRGFWAGLKRSRGLRLFALTAATTAAIFLFLGAQPVSQNAENPIEWNQFRLSMQSENLG